MSANSSGYIEYLPAAAVLELVAPAATAPALETYPNTAGFTQDHSGSTKTDC